jgi:hypothetical protein
MKIEVEKIMEILSLLDENTQMKVIAESASKSRNYLMLRSC